MSQKSRLSCFKLTFCEDLQFSFCSTASGSGHGGGTLYQHPRTLKKVRKKCFLGGESTMTDAGQLPLPTTALCQKALKYGKRFLA